MNKRPKFLTQPARLCPTPGWPFSLISSVTFLSLPDHVSLLSAPLLTTFPQFL